MFMIFVTVSGWPFERLIKKMDDIGSKTREKVVMQIGDTKYTPKHAEYFRFTSTGRIEELNRKARIIVSHGGAGCIIRALRLKKPLIVVPRYKKFGEHVNDHQLDLTVVLEGDGKITAVYDIDNLEVAIKSAIRGSKTENKKNGLVEYIKGYIEGLDDKYEHSNGK